MKKNLVLSIVVLAALLTAGNLIAYTGVHTGTTAQTSTATVNVNIPGIVGVDVETDLIFDFGTYTAGGIGGPCANNIYPPAAGCTGRATFAATTTTNSGTAPSPSGVAGELWVAVLSTVGGASPALTINTRVDAAWTGVAPGFATTDLRYRQAAVGFNPAGVGPAAATAFASANAALALGTLGGATHVNPFGWTRIDQIVDLEPGLTATIANTSDVPFQTTSNASCLVYYVVSHF